MDLILDKLGRIDHAEIEIRPLTVFVGENNTNKTWAAYCLYGLARSQARNPDITTGFSSDDTPTARLDDDVAGNVDGLARAARERSRTTRSPSPRWSSGGPPSSRASRA